MDGFTVAQEFRRNDQYRESKVILLTSAGSPADAVRCRELGVAGYLTKPIKQSELFDSIVNALAEHTVRHQPQESISDPFANSGTSRRVLLAEDNPVNQTLATRILEKLGHTVKVANNGKEAVQHAMTGEFDVVLMDVQMPEMDGLEATAAIRADEAGTTRHLPIVAMTAHAMKGDRENCISAGMDGYLSKPIRVDDLRQTILDVARNRSLEQSAGENPKPFHAIGPLEALLDSVMGDRVLLSEMAELWLTDSVKQINQIQTGLESADPVMIQRAAHALKGSVGTFQASAAHAAAGELEIAAKDGDLVRARKLFQELSKQVDLVTQDLRRLSRK